MEQYAQGMQVVMPLTGVADLQAGHWIMMANCTASMCMRVSPGVSQILGRASSFFDVTDVKIQSGLDYGVNEVDLA